MQKGGKIIGNGGYGCVFQPALACQKDNKTNLQNKVSKLFPKIYAQQEYNFVKQIFPLLKTIPNAENYFILKPLKLCQPAPLSKENLDDFNEKCFSLVREGINSSNVNKNLPKLLSFSMPYGGVTLQMFIENNPTQWFVLNESLIQVFLNFII